MTEFRFPAWRRVIFIAALIVIIVISFAPSVTQGTVNVRVYGFAPGDSITHVYVRFSEVRLHTAGYPSNAGWVNMTNLLPAVDVVPHPGQVVPEALISARIQSGRYDAITLIATNSTVVIGDVQGKPVFGASTITANVTLPVQPSGVGEVLVVVLVDYSSLLADQPVLSLKLHRATAS